MPSASRARKNEVIKTLEGLPCEVLSIPGMVDLVEGRQVLIPCGKSLLQTCWAAILSHPFRN
jgi:FlaA1/EpsC-like NDP-sugar epimerase